MVLLFVEEVSYMIPNACNLLIAESSRLSEWLNDTSTFKRIDDELNDGLKLMKETNCASDYVYPALKLLSAQLTCISDQVELLKKVINTKE